MEKRQRRIEILRVARIKILDAAIEILATTIAIVLHPVGTHELVALDILYVDRLERFMEDTLPITLEIRAQHILRENFRVGKFLFDRRTVVMPSPIVVARNEHLFDISSVRSAVAGKYGFPCRSNRLKVADNAQIGDIAADHNRINTIVAEILERMAEGIDILPPKDMNIAYHAKAQTRHVSSLER